MRRQMKYAKDDEIGLLWVAIFGDGEGFRIE
jgi:hypothetical protein